MAKEDPSKEARRKAKKEEKERKRLAEEAGVQKPRKKDKAKEKKKKGEKFTSVATLKALENGSEATPAPMTGEIIVEEEEVKPFLRPIGALVPFANPLADEKVAKKCFRGVKKAAANRALKRGVKEVVKSLRKSPLPRSTISTLTSSAATVAQTPSSISTDSGPPGIVILAADISPLDVISHIPVLCEDHGIPYVYVTSRAELGIAGGTKRPTSVVLIGRETAEKAKKTKRKKKDGEGDVGEGEGETKGAEEPEDDWPETYRGLVKLVDREQARVRI